MKNKNLFKSIMISIIIYMIFSWIIVAGNFSQGEYTSTGFNQIGIFDLFVAPLQLFNYFVVSVTKNVNGYVNQVGYGNIIIALISIAIFYGVLNEVPAYSNLVDTLSKKMNKKKQLSLIITASIFYVISALTGLNLILFLLFPFVAALLSKLNYRKVVVFFSTIGALLLGQISSLYNPNINGVNRILLQIGLNDNILVRIILFLIIWIILVATLCLTKNKMVKKENEVLLLNYEKKSNKIVKGKNYLPIVIVSILTIVILFVCMYNWYYMFNSTVITESYQKLLSYNIKNYNFMQNIFGISEQFGYWTGFTMSALLIIDSLIISFMYKIKFNDMFKGAKKAIYQMLPTIFCSVMSLTIIILSLYNTNSFMYSIINNILNGLKNNQILGIFSTSLLHNFFVNDYFALLSSLSNQFISLYGTDGISLTVLVTQLAHGIISLITPLNVYLVAGLAFLGISYKAWMKYIWKLLLILIVISLLVPFILSIFS